MVKADTDVEVGRSAGKALFDSIGKAKRRLFVVSPWISSACAELAVKKQREGLDVRIFTTNDPSPSHLTALSNLIETGERPVRKRIPVVQAGGLILILAGLISIALAPELRTALTAIVLMGAGVLAFRLGAPRTKRYWKPKIGDLTVYDCIASPFVHAKVYVFDDGVAVGSANFTVSGLQRNVEGIAFLRGNGIADRILAQLNSEPLVKLPLERVAKQIQMLRR